MSQQNDVSYTTTALKGVSTTANDGEIGKSETEPTTFEKKLPKSKKRCFEIEEKFSILSQKDISILETKLIELGFEKVGNDIEFMDWYFDLPEPNYVLSVTDNWLRYRELLVSPSSSPLDQSDDVNKYDKQGRNGVWQLKCGKKIPVNDGDKDKSKSATTVYEELEGDDAIDLALSIVQDKKKTNLSSLSSNCDNDTHKLMDGYVIPSLPKNNEHYELIPFARIKTTRSSWSKKVNDENINYDDNRNTLNVDIDCADFGYMVGEVEQVVDREEDIITAKEVIAKTIKLITGEEKSINDGTTLGKLEFYLIQNRKSHYDECVSGGSMKKITNE